MRPLIPALALAFVAGAALAGSESKEATDTVLIKQPLHGMEGKVAHVVRSDIPPGFQTPRHSHPANVFVYVLEGAIEVELEGVGTKTAKAGEIIYETPDTPMVGRNLSSEEGARILVFHVGEEGEPVQVPED